MNTFTEPVLKTVTFSKRRPLIQQPSFVEFTDIPNVDEIKETIAKWDFEVFHFKNEDLTNHIIVMFDNLGNRFTFASY